MIWFMAFTTLGFSITLFLLLMKWSYRPTLKGWVSGVAILALGTFLSQK